MMSPYLSAGSCTRLFSQTVADDLTIDADQDVATTLEKLILHLCPTIPL